MLKLFPGKWSFLIRIRFSFGLILVFLIAVFLYLKVMPFGVVSYERVWPGVFKSGKGFIYGFSPAIRLAGESDLKAVKIIAEPMYFSVFAPRAFEEAILKIKYNNQLDFDVPIIEAGLIKDEITRSAEIKPLENKILDKLISSWSVLEEGGETLALQRNKNYSEGAEFYSDLKKDKLKDCPGGARTCVAVYNYKPDINSSYSEIKISPIVINQAWRGSHQFFVYLNRGEYQFDFDFNTLDKKGQSSLVKANLYLGEKILNSQSLNNSQNLKSETQPKKTSLSFKVKSENPGIYRVELKMSDEMIISKISSPSDKLAFINRVWPVGEIKIQSLFTDVNLLQVRTTEVASLGKINFGSQAFNFDKTYEQFIFKSENSNQEIKLTQTDIIFENNGVFSLFSDSLINPSFKKIDRYFVPSDGIKYIIANYTAPQDSNGLKVAMAKFNLNGAFYDKRKYNFLISIPGLTDASTNTKYLEIKEISIELKGKTLWQKIFN